MTGRNAAESGRGERNAAEKQGYTIIDEAHDVPETLSTERQHLLDKSCWCNTTVEGTTVVHRRPLEIEED